MNERLTKLRAQMSERQLEALLVTNADNRRYLTGFTGSSGYVVVTMHRAVFLTDFRYQEQAAAQVQGCEVVIHGPKVTDTIKEVLSDMGARQLAIEQNDMTYGDFLRYSEALDGVELVPSDDLIERLRMIKDDSELAVMQEAATLADRAFEHIIGYLKPGVAEREIALELEMFMRKNGATSSSFDTIVASGERSALPHGVAGERTLGSSGGGEFITLDFGAYYKGYCSDITRTVLLGEPTDKHRDIYEIVLEAQMTALEGLRPGMTGKQADALARDVITKYGYGERFGHGTGHGLGMQVHEAPRLSITGHTVLEPGMTVTVEPGIYIPGFGGVRIEDDVVITENGARRLTQSDKRFTVVK